MSNQHMHQHFLQNARDKDLTTTLSSESSENIERVITMTPIDVENAPEYNYAEALQKSIYFYEAQKSGPGVTGGRVIWRGDANLADATVPLKPFDSEGNGTNMSQDFIDQQRQWLDPQGKGTLDVSGGFHDAGDHVKFGLPQGYSASTLGWAFYEFRQAFIEAGQEAQMLEVLRWFTDYFLRTTFRNGQGRVIAFAHQVGDGKLDHEVWSPPEVQKIVRPALFATAETPGSDVCAEVAAALVLMYLNVKESDAAYAAACLEVGQELYLFATENRGLSSTGGFYNSTEDEDDLAWAAIWLYVATGEKTYLNDILAVDADNYYTGYLKRVLAKKGDSWQNLWVLSWDAVWEAVFLKLAHITDETRFQDIARWNLEYWSGIEHQDSADKNYLPATPAGFKVISTWGSTRYNAAAQLCALMYRKYTGDADFADWAREQMGYILGKNPMGRSYIVGFGENAACHPHHRAAHGSFNNNILDPIDPQHILWGGLVGGPGYDDRHNDAVDDYEYNEVAIDYNAGLIGALAGLYTFYGWGQQSIADFAPSEPPVEQYFVEVVKSEKGILLTLHNDSIHPPHLERNMKARYFFNSRDLLIGGGTLADIEIRIFMDELQIRHEGAIAVRGPIIWNEEKGLAYYEFDWSGYDIWGRRMLEFALLFEKEGSVHKEWDPKNDWSGWGLTETQTVVDQIPVYLNGHLVYGEEPSDLG